MGTQHEARDNSGALFANKRRENDRQPTHTGQCVIDGKPYWMDAWVKDGRDGRFFSIAFKPKLARDQGATGNPLPARTRPTEPEFDDDIPF
jgi:hypothetical protein